MSSLKEKPGRITDFKITGYSKENDLLTLEWTVPSASFGTQGIINSVVIIKLFTAMYNFLEHATFSDKPDYYKVAYGYNSTIVIDAVTGLIPTKASLVNDVSQPGEPGSTQQMTIKLNQPQGSSSLLYFTISSVKNGTAEVSFSL